MVEFKSSPTGFQCQQTSHIPNGFKIILKGNYILFPFELTKWKFEEFICPKTIPFVWLPKSDFKLSLQTTNLQPCGPVHNSSWSGRKGMDDNSMRGSKVLGPHLKPPGMMGNVERLCRFPWAFLAAFCPNPSAWVFVYLSLLPSAFFLSQVTVKKQIQDELWSAPVSQRHLAGFLCVEGFEKSAELCWERWGQDPTSALTFYLFIFLAQVLFPFLSPSCEIWFIANCATPWKLWVPSTFHGFKS